MNDVAASAATAATVSSLQAHIIRLEAELTALRNEPAAAAAAASKQDAPSPNAPLPLASSVLSPPAVFGVSNLSRDEVERYSRQMLLEELGPTGTRKLLDSKVLVIGAGGLGSAVCPYLAAAGVGHITIVDFDTVERSNLHRQVMHNDHRVGMLKVNSALLTCKAINPNCRVEVIAERFDVWNAQELCHGCDVVVDASDNVATRYIVNDAAVLEGKPLVSGSAMRFDGQLSVFNNGPAAPCYRCVFPRPPVVEASCNETGVCGVVPGIIGSLQAMEAIKVIAGIGEPLSGRMLLYNALSATFKVVKMRARQATCCVCSAVDSPHRIIKSIVGAYPTHPEYDARGGCHAPDYNLLQLPTDRMDMKEFGQLLVGKPQEQKGEFPTTHASSPRKSSVDDIVVIDVRSKVQYAMVAMPASINIPYSELRRRESSGGNEVREYVMGEVRKEMHQRRKRQRGDNGDAAGGTSGEEGCSDALPSRIFVACRRGIGSVEATAMLNKGSEGCGTVRFVNLDGGINKYHADVDKEFPCY